MRAVCVFACRFSIFSRVFRVAISSFVNIFPFSPLAFFVDGHVVPRISRIPDRWTMVDAHAMEIEYSYARYGFPIPGPARAARDRMSAAPPPRVGRREKMANFDAQPRPRS